MRSPRAHAASVSHWEDGGLTVAANLVMLCPQHHRAVHNGDLAIEGNPEDGTLVFRDARGERIEPPAFGADPLPPPEPHQLRCRQPYGERLSPRDFRWNQTDARGQVVNRRCDNLTVERRLTEWEQAVVLAMAPSSWPGAEIIRDSLPHLVVIAECECGCPSFTVADRRSARSGAGQGHFSNGVTPDGRGLLLLVDTDGRPYSIDCDWGAGEPLPDPAEVVASVPSP